MKDVIDKYRNAIPYSLLKYCPIKKNEENLYIIDPFCDNLDDIDNYCNDFDDKSVDNESVLSVYDNIPELKEKYFYIIKDCPEFDTNTQFDDIDKYLKNFELIFNHNAKILEKIKEYLKNRLKEIKDLNYDLVKDFKFTYNISLSESYPKLLGIDVEDCFKIILDCKKFILDDKKEYEKINNLDIINDFFSDIPANLFSSNTYRLYFGSKSSDIDNKKDKKNITELKYVFLNIEVFKYLIYLLYLRFGINKVDKKDYAAKIEGHEEFYIDKYFNRLIKSDPTGKKVGDIDFYLYTNVIHPNNSGIVFTTKSSEGKPIYYILFNEFYKFFNECEEEFFKRGLLDKKVLNYEVKDDDDD